MAYINWKPEKSGRTQMASTLLASLYEDSSWYNYCYYKLLLLLQLIYLCYKYYNALVTTLAIISLYFFVENELRKNKKNDYEGRTFMSSKPRGSSVDIRWKRDVTTHSAFTFQRALNTEGWHHSRSDIQSESDEERREATDDGDLPKFLIHVVFLFPGYPGSVIHVPFDPSHPCCF